MAASKHGSFLPLLMLASLLNGGSVVSSDGLNPSGSVVKGEETTTSPPGLSAAAAAVDKLAVFQTWPAGWSLSLLSSFPEDLEMSDYCRELLHIFGQRYIAYANCLVSYARPVKVCQNCFPSYVSLNDTFQNISSNQVRTKPGPNHRFLFRRDCSFLIIGPSLASRCLMIAGLMIRSKI